MRSRMELFDRNAMFGKSAECLCIACLCLAEEHATSTLIFMWLHIHRLGKCVSKTFFRILGTTDAMNDHFEV